MRLTRNASLETLFELFLQADHSLSKEKKTVANLADTEVFELASTLMMTQL